MVVYRKAGCVVKEVFEIDNSLIGSTLTIETSFKTLNGVFRRVKVSLFVDGNDGLEETRGFVTRSWIR